MPTAPKTDLITAADLTAQHLGATVELDYIPPYADLGIFASGTLDAFLARGDYVTIWLANSDQFNADEPITVGHGHQIGVTS